MINRWIVWQMPIRINGAEMKVEIALPIVGQDGNRKDPWFISGQMALNIPVVTPPSLEPRHLATAVTLGVLTVKAHIMRVGMAGEETAEGTSQDTQLQVLFILANRFAAERNTSIGTLFQEWDCRATNIQ
jgi:hypothetical protein